MKKLTVILLLLLPFCGAFAQQPAVVYGYVADSTNTAADNISIGIQGKSSGTVSEDNGYYELKVAPGTSFILVFAAIGRRQILCSIPALEPGQRYRRDAKIPPPPSFAVVDYKMDRDRNKVGVISIDPKLFKNFPNPSGSIEAMLKTLGAGGNNELSSGYTVRGGSFDENLVYVNEIEVFRPQLVRSGQQEGLSFINPDMVESIRFSAGGFEARYGDKLSSVLDITYKKPKSFEAGAHANLMGGQLYLQGRPTTRFTYLLGARFRSNQYLLGSLDVQGNYKPRFADVQALIGYDLSSKLNVSLLSTFAQNRFLFYPQNQQTSFGTVQEALQLSVFFNGAELMQYSNFLNALSFTYQPKENFSLKWITSAYLSNEREYLTVEGAYRLDELDKELNSQTFGQAKFNRGAGYFINHARNDLYATVLNTAVKGNYFVKRHTLHFGAQVQREIIDDRVNEWVYNDSADYSVPFNSGDSLYLDGMIRGQANLVSTRYSAYFQDTYIIDDTSNLILVLGLRTNYWDLNKQNVLSPRGQISFEPNRRYNRGQVVDSLKKRDIVLKAAAGVYYQPPFYREMRDLSGKVHTDVKAQRSIHFVAGGDMNFKAWGRPFKLYGELYYKKLDFLVPYQLENVRIRYFANNNSRGYATGLDARINGEFIKDLESWFSLSILQTKEKITYTGTDGIQVETPYLRRPTDQRVNVGIFFQDELPQFERCKMHLNLVFGSGLPYFLGGAYRFTEGFKIPPYRRVDIGFSYTIISEKEIVPTRLGKIFKSLSASLELFNALGINNTVSYIWVRDVNANTYAVPNYLTSRRINLNLQFSF